MADSDNPDTTPETDTPLWRFALTLWKEERARELCLQLQTQGWSVTRLLCAGWLAGEGVPYSGLEPKPLQQWRRNVTESIRALKQSLSKSDSLLATLRETLARAELEAERVELYQAWLTLRETHLTEGRILGGSLTESNLRQAAPADQGSINETTEPMIRHLAKLMNTVSCRDAGTTGSQPT